MEKHPAALLELIAKQTGIPFAFEFSKYFYKPQSTEDEREYFSFPAADAYQLALEQMQKLAAPFDLALHSRLDLKHRGIHHIPMLDLACEMSDEIVPALTTFLREFGVKEFAVYSSGRSGHVYGLNLIPDTALTKYFARALLLNLPGKSPIVDSRWIGHRLYAGYGSLRWTCNSPQYLQLPTEYGRYSL
jgi:hypothetical protein